MAKDDVLYVRCNSTTVWRFKIWTITSGSKNYEESLNKLLDIAKVPKKEINSI